MYVVWIIGRNPFDHSPIGHHLLTTLEQWKASRHRLLWWTVIDWIVVKRHTS